VQETSLLEVAFPKSTLGHEEVVGIIPHRPPHLPNEGLGETPSGGLVTHVGDV
jgi:hypothetical protein